MRLKLFIMMVLELFIWGAWLPLVWSYIGTDGLNFTGRPVVLKVTIATY